MNTHKQTHRAFPIAVTREHVENSLEKDSHHCMVADAVHTAVPWAAFVMADIQTIRFSNLKTGQRYIFLTPPAAQKAIIKFDQGKNVSPFEFTLNQGYSRTMRIRQGEVKRTTKTGKKNAKPTRVMLSRFREFGVRALG